MTNMLSNSNVIHHRMSGTTECPDFQYPPCHFPSLFAYTLLIICSQNGQQREYFEGNY